MVQHSHNNFVQPWEGYSTFTLVGMSVQPEGLKIRGLETRGVYSSMILVGTCHWDLKSRPIFIPNFDENETHFYTRAKIFKQISLKISHYFPKKYCKLSSKLFLKILISDWWNWSYFQANLRKYWKCDPYLYQEADFVTLFSGMSPDRPLY